MRSSRCSHGAKDELDTIIKELRPSRKDQRKAQRHLKGALDIYWGGAPSHADVARHVPRVAGSLAVTAYLAGQRLPEPELIELATRLVYWSTATKAYPNGWRTEDKSKPPADIGDPVRDAVTVAFARRLPEPVRAALGLDRHQLPEILRSLDNQDLQLLEQLLDLPRPDLGTDAGDPGGGAVAERPPGRPRP